ncbi:Protein CBG05435 [Caenorhabditis briggsae]|uniref:Protein CBG05435 n=1 Tax=Caenorhabditis briggsae TaxID=6238 RepID=E3CTY0_CAEBR|nr:Protein CBG05435 [Caenorhabditis briggsae]CBX33023.1 Protein CBG05435 [Caenorhabditis briggsae]
MIGFWPEFEGAACYAAHKYFGDNNRRWSRKKEYETYQINKIQVNIFNVKCLGDIATGRIKKKLDARKFEERQESKASSLIFVTIHSDIFKI